MAEPSRISRYLRTPADGASRLGWLNWLDAAERPCVVRVRLAAPDDPTSHPPKYLEHDCKAGSLAVEGRSANLGGPDDQWRDAFALAATLAPHCGTVTPSPLLHDRESRSASSVLPNDVAPRRASIPPWPPRQRDPDRFCQSGTHHPHLCIIDAGALRASSASLAETRSRDGRG